jgi:hypothetical protein
MNRKVLNCHFHGFSVDDAGYQAPALTGSNIQECKGRKSAIVTSGTISVWEGKDIIISPLIKAKRKMYHRPYLHGWSLVKVSWSP